MKSAITPRHKWTHNGDRVLILKCVNADGTSFGGFRWPESGQVRPDKWSRDPTCESGGLFGWPWGFGLGDGQSLDFSQGRWIVFSAHPDDVIDMDGKAKAVPNDEAGRCPEVVFCGDYFAAWRLIVDGHVAWIHHASSGAATASGYRGAATASGYSGAATASGYRGAATASGYRGAATASGYSGAATASGDRGAATASGDRGAATASGYSGVATASGNSGVATASGNSGAATASGYGGAATASGYGGAATASGNSGVATASGNSGAATASGYSGAATASGYKGAATVTGEYSTVEASPTGLAASTAERFYWRVRTGAVLSCRFGDKAALIREADIGAADGDVVKIERCEIVSEFSH